MRQSKQESIDDFAVRLRAAAILCEFGEDSDAEIKRQIIIGCHATRLKERILETPGVSLSDLLKSARTGEFAREQARAIDNPERHIKSEPVSAIGNRPQQRRQPTKPARESKKCFSCGRDYPHDERGCPAKDKACNLCKQVGHF